MFRGMHFGENGEEVAVQGGGVGHAGIAKEQGEDGGQGNPQNHCGEEQSSIFAVESFDEQAGQMVGVLRDAPGNNAQQAGLHGQIQRSDAEDRKENAARNIFFGVANFTAQVANIVVTPVAVNRVDHGGAEPGKPERGKVEGAGWKIEGQFGIEVAHPSPDKPEQSGNYTDPQRDGNLAYSLNAAVKENDQKNDQAAGDYFGLPGSERMQIACIACEANGSGGNRERRLHKSLPDEQERQQTAPTRRTVGFTQEDVSAAGFGHRCAELGPHEAIECGEKRAGQPGDHSLRTAHGADDQGADDERSDADDLDHIEGDGFFEAETALEGGGIGGSGGRHEKGE